MTRLSRLMAGSMLAFAAVAAVAAPPRVALDTSFGRIVVELDPERAPVTTANFLRYVEDGHYQGTIFHRVVENFVIQGGGHDRTMREKPTRPTIVNEARNGLSNTAGTIAMARQAAIDSASSQFFINVVDNLRLDHAPVPPEGVAAERAFGYAVFGRVVEGADVVERIRHVPVGTVGEYQNVPIEPIVIDKAVLLPQP